MSVRGEGGVLVSSPAKSKGALATFLSMVDRLAALTRGSRLRSGICYVCVSPLGTLSGSVRGGLRRPLEKVRRVTNHSLKVEGTMEAKSASRCRERGVLGGPPRVLVAAPRALSVLLITPGFERGLDNIGCMVVSRVRSLTRGGEKIRLDLSLRELRRLVKRCAEVKLSTAIDPLRRITEFLMNCRCNIRQGYGIIGVGCLGRLSVRMVYPMDSVILTSRRSAHLKVCSLLSSLVRRGGAALIFAGAHDKARHFICGLGGVCPVGCGSSGVVTRRSSLSGRIELSARGGLGRKGLGMMVSSASLRLKVSVKCVSLIILVGSPGSITETLREVKEDKRGLRRGSGKEVVMAGHSSLIRYSILLGGTGRNGVSGVGVPAGYLSILTRRVCKVKVRGP